MRAFRAPALAVALLGQVATADGQGRPAVPPARDPGGVAVALIGGGIDYTVPRLAQRLARDGEGELIGWDLQHNDRRPFARDSSADAGLAAALAEGEGLRLVPVRLDAADVASHARAVAFVARTPARVAVVSLEGAPPGALEPLSQAAARFKAVLLILQADAARALPALRSGETVLGVAPADTGAAGAGPLALAAAAHAAAALLARDPQMDAATLKRRLAESGGTAWRAQN